MAQKTVHILTHFEQEICDICNQNLFRIGENFYVLHGAITCIPRNIKTETSPPPPSPYELIDEYERDDTSAQSVIQFVQDLKDESEAIEDENGMSDQHFSPTQEDYVDTAEDYVDLAVSIEPSIKDERFDQYSARENRCEKTQSLKCTKIIENQNTTRVKAKYRQNGSKNTHFECNECDKTYTRSDHLKRHVIEVHRASEKKFACTDCGNKFSLQYRLNSHKKSSKICNICGKLFCMQRQLLVHQEEEHDMFEKDNEKNIKSSKCKIDGCNEEIAAYRWIEHMANKHTASKQKKKVNRYECETCHKTYRTKDGVEFHILSIHCPSSKKYKCQICSYTTVTQKALEVHQKKIHFKPRNFMCSECGKTFLLRSNLKMHSYQVT